MTSPGPALAIDATEWFVDEAWREHVSPRHWRRLPSRSAVAIAATLQRLAVAQVRATFFVPVELADSDPDLLRRLVDAGHEVGLAVRAHWRLDEVPDQARVELAAAWGEGRAALEAATGRRVLGFRSAWSVGAGEAWWLPVLRDLGFVYDATSGRTVDGAEFACEPFAAWRLDDEQPPLMGLSASVRAPHQRAVRSGGQDLNAVIARASLPVAAVLGLPMDEVASRAPVERADAAPCRLATDVPRLAIIVPLKDEADGIAALFRELDNVANALVDCADCEFVVVDDGSTDRTWELLERHAGERPRVQLLRHQHNQGVAAAIRTGIQASDADWVASIDGDLSYDPMELRTMTSLMADAEVVTASPYHPRGGVNNVPGWRLFLSRTLSFAYRVLLLRGIHTWTSCFRVYRRTFVTDLPLRNGGFLGTAELLVRVLRRGGRVVEHPCVLEARLLGFSKMRVLHTVLGHVRLLWLVMWRRIK